MGPVKLPFLAPAAGFNPDDKPEGYLQILRPMPGSIMPDRLLFVAVVFDDPTGSGVVTLGVPALAGGTAEMAFKQDGTSEMVAVPYTEDGLYLRRITPRSKGYILVATSR